MAVWTKRDEILDKMRYADMALVRKYSSELQEYCNDDNDNTIKYRLERWEKYNQVYLDIVALNDERIRLDTVLGEWHGILKSNAFKDNSIALEILGIIGKYKGNNGDIWEEDIDIFYLKKSSGGYGTMTTYYKKVWALAKRDEIGEEVRLMRRRLVQCWAVFRSVETGIRDELINTLQYLVEDCNEMEYILKLCKNKGINKNSESLNICERICDKIDDNTKILNILNNLSDNISSYGSNNGEIYNAINAYDYLNYIINGTLYTGEYLESTLAIISDKSEYGYNINNDFHLDGRLLIFDGIYIGVLLILLIIFAWFDKGRPPGFGSHSLDRFGKGRPPGFSYLFSFDSDVGLGNTNRIEFIRLIFLFGIWYGLYCIVIQEAPVIYYFADVLCNTSYIHQNPGELLSIIEFGDELVLSHHHLNQHLQMLFYDLYIVPELFCFIFIYCTTLCGFVLLFYYSFIFDFSFLFLF